MLFHIKFGSFPLPCLVCQLGALPVLLGAFPFPCASLCESYLDGSWKSGPFRCLAMHSSANLCPRPSPQVKANPSLVDALPGHIGGFPFPCCSVASQALPAQCFPGRSHSSAVLHGASPMRFSSSTVLGLAIPLLRICCTAYLSISVRLDEIPLLCSGSPCLSFDVLIRAATVGRSSPPFPFVPRQIQSSAAQCCSRAVQIKSFQLRCCSTISHAHQC